MSINQEDEQKAKADRLRAQVAKLTGQAEDDSVSEEPTSEKPQMSPREFIQRRMQELKEKKGE
jgi:hypothetical protein